MTDKCPNCGSVLSVEDGIGTCPFCMSTFKMETIHNDSKLFKNEPLILEEPDEVADENIDYEIRDAILSFTCPKCSVELDGTPERCPSCGTKLKYIAVEDIDPVEELPEEVNEEIKEVEEDIEPSLEDPWPEDEVEYADIATLKANRIVSVVRTTEDDEHFYKITYRDGSELSLSAKAMRLRGLMIKK